MSDQATEEFLACFLKEQRSIYVIVRSLLVDPSDAEEVYQETCLAIWKDFKKYTPGTDFGAWARQVARNRILAHVKRRTSDRHEFSTELVETLVNESQARDDSQLTSRREALADCLKKLSEADQRLVKARYEGRETIVEFASSESCSVSKLYGRLVRIRHRLVDCIDRSLNASHQASL